MRERKQLALGRAFRSKKMPAEVLIRWRPSILTTHRQAHSNRMCCIMVKYSILKTRKTCRMRQVFLFLTSAQIQVCSLGMILSILIELPGWHKFWKQKTITCLTSSSADLSRSSRSSRKVPPCSLASKGTLRRILPEPPTVPETWFSRIWRRRAVATSS